MPQNLRCTIALLSRRSYSAPAGAARLINAKSIPAPHCGSIRILSLNRPEARNAISRQLLSELKHEIKSIEAEGGNLSKPGPTRALILASEVDASFCAGADLKERKTMTQEE
jgi:methylglutaconyl-CoA hydratase